MTLFSAALLVMNFTSESVNERNIVAEHYTVPVTVSYSRRKTGFNMR